MEKKSRKSRQEAIIKIVSENEIETQAELIERLEGLGFTVGQATVSRDIKELKLEKRVSEYGVSCYSFMNSNEQEIPYIGIFDQSVISMDRAMNTVVLKCHPGFADAACKVVDEQRFDSVVGTIAGDDTVFILTRSENHAIRLMGLLGRLKGQ